MYRKKEKRMKKFVTALLLGVALIFGVVGCHGPESLDLLAESNDHNSVTQTQLTDLQKQIDALKEQLAALVAAGDNVVVIDNSTINNINAQIADLTEQLAKLQAEFDALKDQVGTDNVTIDNRLTVLEGDVAALNQAIIDINKEIKNLWTAIEDLPGSDRPAGGPAYVFSGAGAPSEGLDAREGDFFISTTNVSGRHGFGYIIYLYTSDGWIEFGLIKVGSGDAVDTASPTRIQRF